MGEIFHMSKMLTHKPLNLLVNQNNTAKYGIKKSPCSLVQLANSIYAPASIKITTLDKQRSSIIWYNIFGL